MAAPPSVADLAAPSAHRAAYAVTAVAAALHWGWVLLEACQDAAPFLEGRQEAFLVGRLERLLEAFLEAVGRQHLETVRPAALALPSASAIPGEVFAVLGP